MGRIVCENGDELFRELITTVLSTGQASAPRGKPVMEIAHPTVITLADPSSPLVMTELRKPNWRFGFAEACWIAAGLDEITHLAKHNKRMAEFSDDERTLWGAYGPRVLGQLGHVISVLSRDRDSRQAVVTTWRPMVPCVAVDINDTDAARPLHAAGLVDGNMPMDLPPWDGASWRSKDVPCTVAWHFMVRRDRLNLSVFMRSNDVWLGVPYDILSFTTIQRAVAAILKIEVGEYNHVVSNLHLYHENLAQAEAVLSAPKREQSRLPSFQFADLPAMASAMSAALNGRDTGDVGAEHYANVIHRRGVTVR